MNSKLFPLYLNIGSKGPAVACLQVILQAKGFNPNIVVDGEYGEETALGVRRLQAELGANIDGHFGPATRRALAAQTGFDVNLIDSTAFAGETQAVMPSR